MTPEAFNELLERKLTETRSVLASKATEYAHGGDRLSNFKRAAGLLNSTPEAALLGFVTKHITALFDFIQALEDGRCMPLDQWAEKTGDIRNYMILLDGLLEERLLVQESELVGDTPGAFMRRHRARRGVHGDMDRLSCRHEAPVQAGP